MCEHQQAAAAVALVEQHGLGHGREQGFHGEGRQVAGCRVGDGPQLEAGRTVAAPARPTK